MKPRDESNYLVEVTPEVMSEINQIWMHSDTEPIAELHFSPYWKRNKEES